MKRPASVVVPFSAPSGKRLAAHSSDGASRSKVRPAVLVPQEEMDAAMSCSSLTIDHLRTPSYILYKSVMENNAKRMLDRAAALGCALRPHMKTHKTLEGGVLATGGTRRRIAVSTLAEAEFFADGGFDDILYAVPITPAKLPLARQLAERLSSFHICLDNPETLACVLAYPLPSSDLAWSVVLMVDCGYGRDGIDPADPVATDMVRNIVSSGGHAKFAGLYTHGGHSYDRSGNPAEAAAAVRQIAREEAQAVAKFAAALREEGFEVPMVGVGSTPTCSNPPEEGLQGVSEMHPGNYIYYDVMQEKLGSCNEKDIAVRVVTRIIGHYAKKNLILVDMGWTACSKQGEEIGYGRIEDHPELKIINLKQEAGLISSCDNSKLDLSHYPLGMLLRLEPYHSCAHTKQHDRVHVLDDDRRTLIDTWEICRGW